MAVEAARMAKAGKGVAEILARLEAIRPEDELLLTLKDLRYAQMSGRVGKLAGQPGFIAQHQAHHCPGEWPAST